jgi:hypothetical protein
LRIGLRVIAGMASELRFFGIEVGRQGQAGEQLHDLVCAGGMKLRSVQRQIASNWQKLYKKVFVVWRMRRHNAGKSDAQVDIRNRVNRRRPSLCQPPDTATTATMTVSSGMTPERLRHSLTRYG